MQYNDNDLPPPNETPNQDPYSYYEIPPELGTKNYGGPYTMVPLCAWRAAFSRRCSTASLIPIFALLVFSADVVLSFFAGFDLVNRGPGRPWIQFSLSLGVAFLYSTLAVVAWVMYGWERVLRFRYHWVLGLGVSALVAWINFAIWASWQTRFSSFVGHVESTDGNAFVTWVAVNGVGIAGFLVRFAVLCLAQGIRHVYDRVVELQAIVYSRSSGGKSIYQALGISKAFGQRQSLAQGRPSWNLSGMSPSVSAQGNARPQSRYMRQFADTNWAQQARRQTGGNRV